MEDLRTFSFENSMHVKIQSVKPPSFEVLFKAFFNRDMTQNCI